MLTILFDGIAYGMLLFVLAVGLAVTMGLMNFINLAHGAFAMAGGYITVLLMSRLGVPSDTIAEEAMRRGDEALNAMNDELFNFGEFFRAMEQNVGRFRDRVAIALEASCEQT